MEKDKDLSFFKNIKSESKNYSYELISGILISDTYLRWIGANKKAKHNVSPDVISEFPIPSIKKGKKGKLKKALLKLTAKDISLFTLDECVLCVEQIVKEMMKKGTSTDNRENLIDLLDKSVKKLYSFN